MVVTWVIFLLGPCDIKGRTSYALTDVAQLIGCRPVSQKVAGSVPGWSTCIGCGFSS